MNESTTEELKETYRRLRESFTAADLAEHLQPIVDPVSADEVLLELEEQQRRLDAQGTKA